jgi:FixJ family two-component response regulator
MTGKGTLECAMRSDHRSDVIPLARRSRCEPRSDRKWEVDMDLNAQCPVGMQGLLGPPTVFVVDADPSVRATIGALVCSAGWLPKTFASAEEFIQQKYSEGPCCVVLETSLPGLSGLELQQMLSDRRYMPVIFVTRAIDIATSVRALKAGALEFLTKPFTPEALLCAMCKAVTRSRTLIDQEAERQILRRRYRTLSARERQVMALVAGGLLNKQVGGRLGISENTVKAHRCSVMRKMAANSFAQLVKVEAMLQVALMGEHTNDAMSAGVAG